MDLTTIQQPKFQHVSIKKAGHLECALLKMMVNFQDRIFWLGEWLLASHEGLCPIKLL